MMDEQRLQQGRLQQGQTRGNGPGAVPAPGVGGQGRDRGRGGVGARSESERKPPLGPGTRVRATGRGCPAQRPRLLGFPAGRAGNTPLQCQANLATPRMPCSPSATQTTSSWSSSGARLRPDRRRPWLARTGWWKTARPLTAACEHDPPTTRASWDDKQTPRPASSSRRRGTNSRPSAQPARCRSRRRPGVMDHPPEIIYAITGGSRCWRGDRATPAWCCAARHRSGAS